MKNIYFMASLATLLLAGCSNDDGTPKFENSEPGAKATINAIIDGLMDTPKTKAVDETWTVGDQIGISCTDNYTEIYEQKNFAYKATTANGDFEAVDRLKEIWFLGTNEYQITAYYPYTGAIGIVPNKQAMITNTEYQTPEKQPQIDFLFATAKASYENPAVNFSFFHKMSRLQVQFVSQKDPDSGDPIISNLGTIDCYLVNVTQSGTFDPATGTAIADVKNNEEVKDKNVYQQVNAGNGHKLSLILFPQPEISNARIDAVLKNDDNPDGIYYKIPLSNLHLEVGKSYNYTVIAKLNPEDKKITLEINKGSINDWYEVPTIEVEPEPGKVQTTVEGTTVNGWTPDEEEVDVEVEEAK